MNMTITQTIHHAVPSPIQVTGTRIQRSALALSSTLVQRLLRHYDASAEAVMRSSHLNIVVNGVLGVVEGVIVDAAPVAVSEVLGR